MPFLSAEVIELGYFFQFVCLNRQHEKCQQTGECLLSEKCGFGVKFYNAENHYCENSAVKISGDFGFQKFVVFNWIRNEPGKDSK